MMKLYMLVLLLMALVVRLTRCDDDDYVIPPGPYHVPLTLGHESGPHTTLCGQYGYFKIQTLNACDDIHIELHHIEGQPNLYVGKAPNFYPKFTSLAWSSYSWEHDKVILSSWDPAFVMGTYYISVHAYCGDDVRTRHIPAKYTLLVTSKRHTHPDTDDIFNVTRSGRLTQEKYVYYRACLPSPCYKMRVILQNCIDYKACPEEYAYPELIVSRTKEKPTINDHAWKLADITKRYIDLDPGSDHSVDVGHYYIGIYGWCTPDQHCNDTKTCGPCHNVPQAPYNISVKAVPTENEQCDKLRAAVAEARSSGTRLVEAALIRTHWTHIIGILTITVMLGSHCARIPQLLDMQ